MKIQFARVDHKRSGSTSGAVLYEITRAFLTAVILASLILAFFCRSATVNGESMEPTLHNGDRLLVSSYSQNYKRGDIVIVHREHADPLVKRVIAVPGDTLSIDYTTGTVTVNGKVLQEEYIAEPTYRSFEGGPAFPLEIPDGYLFVMGDNRNNSMDSRDPEVNLVNKNNVLGKMMIDFNNTEAE